MTGQPAILAARAAGSNGFYLNETRSYSAFLSIFSFHAVLSVHVPISTHSTLVPFALFPLPIFNLHYPRWGSLARNRSTRYIIVILGFFAIVVFSLCLFHYFGIRC